MLGGKLRLLPQLLLLPLARDFKEEKGGVKDEEEGFIFWSHASSASARAMHLMVTFCNLMSLQVFKSNEAAACERSNFLTQKQQIGEALTPTRILFKG